MSDEPNNSIDEAEALYESSPSEEPSAEDLPTGNAVPSEEETAEDERVEQQILAAEDATATDAAAGAEGAEAEAPKLRGNTRKPVDEPYVEDEPTWDWYILKVQSNRENSIAEALQRRVAIAGMDKFFGEIIVPTEKVTEFKGGKKRIVKRKLYPGYIVAHMAINDDTWFLVRETPGIGDFTGSAGKPTAMLPHEVARIVQKTEEKTDEAPKLKISFAVGDRVKINEGTFENFEGEVSNIDEASGRIIVMINIFGRSTPVELEYWQAESI